MAINLNKSGEENSKPLEEKKKLNLTKKDDTENVKIDLSKGNVDPKPTSSIPENQEKKKSPIFSVVIVIIGLVIGAFWFLSQEESPVEPLKESENTALTNVAASENGIEVASQTENEAGAAAAVIPESKTDVASSSNQGNAATASSGNATSTKGAPSTPVVSKPSTTPKNGILQGSLEEKAMQVLAGAYGNGEERKRNLGTEYAEIQARVNSLTRNQNQ